MFSTDSGGEEYDDSILRIRGSVSEDSLIRGPVVLLHSNWLGTPIVVNEENVQNYKLVEQKFVPFRPPCIYRSKRSNTMCPFI